MKQDFGECNHNENIVNPALVVMSTFLRIELNSDAENTFIEFVELRACPLTNQRQTLRMRMLAKYAIARIRVCPVVATHAKGAAVLLAS